jgi:hypothetical protein
LEQGVSPQTVAKNAGHSLKTLDRVYSHINMRTLVDEMTWDGFKD